MKKSLNPVWNKYGDFIVQDLDRDDLIIKVWDWDNLTRDDPLGQAELPVSELMNRQGNDQDFWVKLDNAESGKVRIFVQWFTLSQSYDDYVVSKSQALERPGTFSTAVLLLHIDSCSDLSGATTKPSPYVQVSLIGQHDQDTDVVHHTNHPVYKQNFAFLVDNPESDDLYITILDSNVKGEEKRSLGTLKVELSGLLRRKGMEYLCQPWKLNNTGFKDSSIIFSARLLFLKPNADEAELADEVFTEEMPSLTDTMRTSSTASSLNDFNYSQSHYRPQVFIAFNYKDAVLQVTIQSAQWVKIPFHYDGYISIKTLPEGKRDAKRKTDRVPLSDTVVSSPSMYGGQLIFENETFVYEKIEPTDLRTTCLEVKLKAIKVSSKDAPEKRKASFFRKAVLLAHATISLAELDLIKPGDDNNKVKMYSLNVGNESKKLARQSSGGSFGHLVSTQHNTKFFIEE